PPDGMVLARAIDIVGGARRADAVQTEVHARFRGGGGRGGAGSRVGARRLAVLQRSAERSRRRHDAVVVLLFLAWAREPARQHQRLGLLSESDAPPQLGRRRLPPAWAVLRRRFPEPVP